MFYAEAPAGDNARFRAFVPSVLYSNLGRVCHHRSRDV